ncbi:MFS transporter [Lysinibacillus sp. NPDC093197]|uniref:MFS transporter n=1 Tax=Lysinibacillus sp. NPDC093197 TaxID=3364132 RepID=UPI0037F790CE
MSTLQSNNSSKHYAYRWLALAIILLPTLLISLNTYMIQIALPNIQNDLHASFSRAQLIFSGYSIGLATALIIGGKLGDIYGRKKLLWIGVFFFTLTSFVGGMLSDPLLIIGVRIVQGFAAAFIQPQILSIIQDIFPSKEKNLAFGLYGAVIGIAFTFGLILGGLLVSLNLFNGGWRIVFFFNVPFGILVLLLLPIIPESTVVKNNNIDWMGAILLMFSILFFIYPLSEGQTYGWQPWFFGCIILSCVMLASFIFVEKSKQKKHQTPLVDLSLFKHRSFVIGIVSVLSIYLSMFSFFFILSYFIQFGLQYNTKETSLIFLPIGIGFFFTSILSSKIVHLFGLIVLKIGALTMSICIFILIGILAFEPYNLFTIYTLVLLFVYGLGLGLATTPLANAILSKIPKNQVGVASGVFTTIMYLANSLAVAGISIVFSTALNTTLDKASFVHAFSTSLFGIGLLSVMSFVILSIYHKSKN